MIAKTIWHIVTLAGSAMLFSAGWYAAIGTGAEYVTGYAIGVFTAMTVQIFFADPL